MSERRAERVDEPPSPENGTAEERAPAPKPAKPPPELAETAVEMTPPPAAKADPEAGPAEPPVRAVELPKRARVVGEPDWRPDEQWEADPEAGVFNVADKRWSLQSILKQGPVEKLVGSCLWFVVAVSLPVPAIILRDTHWVVAAAVISPVALFVSVRMFRRWKGRRAFADRLIETLDGPIEEPVAPRPAPEAR